MASDPALKARLARLERLAILGELAASFAHEIKNPLSPVRGYAQMLLRRVDRLPEEERELFARGLRIIHDEAERMDARLKELLSLARGQGDTETPVPGGVAINEVVEDVVALVRGEPDAPVITCALDPALPPVLGHADLLRGALLNLVTNANEACGTPGCTVEVRTERSGSSALIRVLDRGPGLSAVDAERMFDPFYTTKDEGTGLGLAIARSAAEAVGGSLCLQSRDDGPGAEAILELPIELEP